MTTNKKLIRAFAANFQHNMLMMFQLCQVVVMISFWSSITLLASDQLHPGEGKNNLATYLIINCLWNELQAMYKRINPFSFSLF
jgi:hypothetical protein